MGGLFVVFEGIDGTGKSSQIELAMQYLSGVCGEGNVVRSKDPGGTKLGLAVRKLIYTEVKTTEMSVGVVDLLFLASHLENWQTVVRPSLLKQKVVVSDRWWYSQEAYSTERVVHPGIAKAYREVHGPNANVMVFLHGDVKIVVDRARGRETETHQSAKQWNDYDKLERIQNTYFNMFSHLPEWVAISVDDKTVAQLWTEVQQVLEPFVNRWLQEHA